MTHKPLTYRRLLVGADLLAKPLDAALALNNPRAGILLPNANALPVTLLSLWHICKIPAVLNYSTSPATMLTCCQLAGLKQIITSRAFLERARLNLDPLRAAGIEFIYLEDLRARITGGQKFASLLRMTFNPSALAKPFAPAVPRGATVVKTQSTSKIPNFGPVVKTPARQCSRDVGDGIAS